MFGCEKREHVNVGPGDIDRRLRANELCEIARRGVKRGAKGVQPLTPDSGTGRAHARRHTSRSTKAVLKQSTVHKTTNYNYELRYEHTRTVRFS